MAALPIEPAVLTPEYAAFLADAQAANLDHIATAGVFYRLPAGPGEPLPLPVFCLCPASLPDLTDATLMDLEKFCIRVSFV
jgi:hypothetical protein